MALQVEQLPGQQRNEPLSALLKKVEAALLALQPPQNQPVRLINTSTMVVPGDEWIFADATGGNIVITLPSAASYNHFVGVKKIDPSGNTVQIIAVPGQTIDGAASATLSAQNDITALVPDQVSRWFRFPDAAGGGSSAIGARVTSSTDLSLADNTFTAVPFDTVTFDDDGFFNIGSPNQLMVPAGGAGLYTITANAQFEHHATTTYDLILTIGAYPGTILAWDTTTDTGTTSPAPKIDLSAIYRLADGNTVELTARQKSGGTLSTGVNSQDGWTPVLSLARIGS